jgi:hypothetical protein
MSLNIVSFDDNTSYEDQVLTLQRSSITIGIHGAALTNTMFMRSGSALLEIVPHGFTLTKNRTAAVHYIQGGHANLWYYQHRTIAEGEHNVNIDCLDVVGPCVAANRDQTISFNDMDWSMIEESIDEAIAYVRRNYNGGMGVLEVRN